MSDPWTMALLQTGLGMLGSAGRGENTATALGHGGRGALAGYQAVQQAGQAERDHMLRMAQVRSQMEQAAQQRQQMMAEAADKKRRQEALGSYESYIQDPQKLAAFRVDPTGYMENQRKASAPMTAYQRAQLGLDQDKFDYERNKPKEPEQTALMRELMAAGLEPGSPEFRETLMEIKTRPQTQINMADKAATAGEVARAQAEAKNTVERQMSVGDELLSVQEGKANAEKMLGLSGEAPSGPGAGLVSGIDKAIEALTFGYGGVGVDSTAYDELSARMSKEVLNAASLLSGTISDKDMETLESVSGGGPLSEEARSNVIRILQEGYAKKERALKAEQEALDSGASAVEAKRAAAKTAQSRRIRYDASGNRIE